MACAPAEYYAVPIGTVIFPHPTCKADTAEIPCCLAHHAHRAYLEGMELRHLRYFEEQNVTRAAVRLHVSQPTLSRQIRDLEDQLGIALFDRGAKAVRLTEAGRVFLTEARIVLEREGNHRRQVQSKSVPKTLCGSGSENFDVIRSHAMPLGVMA